MYMRKFQQFDWLKTLHVTSTLNLYLHKIWTAVPIANPATKVWGCGDSERLQLIKHTQKLQSIILQ